MHNNNNRNLSSAGSIFAGIKGRTPEAVHYQERALRQDPTGAVINTANYDKSQGGYNSLPMSVSINLEQMAVQAMGESDFAGAAAVYGRKVSVQQMLRDAAEPLGSRLAGEVEDFDSK